MEIFTFYKLYIYILQVENVPIAGRTMMKVPGYKEPIEFGVLTSFAYPVEGGGMITIVTRYISVTNHV